MMRIRLSTTFLLLLAISGIAVVAHAQDAATQGAGATPPPVATPKSPEAIPSSELASQAVDAKVKLRHLRDEVQKGDTVVEIEKSLPGLVDRTQKLRSLYATRSLEYVPLSQLEEMTREWRRHGAELQGWSEHLSKNSAVYTQALETLTFYEQVWQKTSEAAEKDGLPPGSIDQISEVRKEIASAGQHVRGLRNESLALQATVSDLRVGVRESIDEIERVAEDKREGILRVDAKPIWQSTSEADSIAAPYSIDSSRQRLAADLRTFIGQYRGRLVLNVFLILFLVAGMLMLRKRVTEWDPSDELLNHGRRIIGRPLSSAIVISLVFIRVAYPLAPLAVYDLAAICVLVPLAILVPRLLPPGLVKPAYGLFVLFFLDRVLVLGPEQSVVRRFELLAIAGLALVGAVWWVRRGSRSARLTRSWMRVTTAVGWAGIVILTLSLVCNVIGAVGFANLLARSMLSGASLGILLFVSVVVLQAATVVLLKSQMAQSLQSVRKNTQLIRKRVLRILAGLAWITWGAGYLRMTRLNDLLITEFMDFFGHTYVFGSLSISVGGVIAFFLTIWIATLLSRFIRFVLNDDVLPRLPLARGVPPTILMLVNYSIVTIGFIIALAAAGIKLSQFAIVAGGLGVGIGFGLQSMVNNFVSGLILLFERPVQVGDTIEVGTLVGTVRRIGIRASTVRTFSGADVIVPNGDILNGHVTNWTLSDMLRRIEIKVGVAYGTDPQAVIDLLVRVASANDKTLSAPEPVALFDGFGDSSLDFQVRFWTSHFDEWMQLGSDVTVAICAALNEAGIEVPFPQRDLHIRSVDAPTRDALAGRGPQSEASSSD